MATNYIAPTWRMPENTNKDKFSNYSINFDSASSNYIDAGTGLGDSLGTYTGDASISLWFKADTTTSNEGLFTMTPFNGSTFGNLRINISSNILYFVSSALTSWKTIPFTDTTSWHHLVCIFKSGDITNSKIYLDGLDQTTTDVGTFPSSLSMTGLKTIIGGYYGTNNTFNGKIDQVTFFDYELSTDQVNYLYNLNNPMAITGKKPTAYWSLGDNSNPIALAGYPNLSIGGSVFDFNGSTQAVDCGTGSRFNIDQITISGWVKLSDNLTNLNIIGGIRNTNNGLITYMINHHSNGKFRFIINQSSDSTYKFVFANDDTVLNTWYHVVGVADGSNVKLYINGDLQTDQTTYDGTITSPTRNFNIGRQPSNPLYYLDGELSNISVFNTGLSQPQVETIYNNGAPNDISSLSPVAWWKLNGIEDVFNAPNWTIKDYGSGSNNGTSVGMTSANLVQSNLDSITPYSNYSVSFDGGTEYFRTPTSYGSYLSGATSCSVSVWVKVDNTSLMQPVVSCWSSPDNTKSYLIRYVSDSRKFQFYLWGPVGAGDSRFGLANAEKDISANTWYHIVGTWNGTTIKIYQDGVFEGSENAPGGALQTVSQQNFTGRYSSAYLGGDVSNQAFWKNTVLTQSEITEIYNAGVTTDLNNFSGTAPTVWYPMDEKATYFPGANNPTEPYIRDIISDRYASGLNMDTSNFVGNAPGSSANGTGNNLDISNLKGEMSNSINNSYSINMADYGDPNNQGLTPANSGRTTEVPG